MHGATFSMLTEDDVNELTECNLVILRQVR